MSGLIRDRRHDDDDRSPRSPEYHGHDDRIIDHRERYPYPLHGDNNYNSRPYGGMGYGSSYTDDRLSPSYDYRSRERSPPYYGANPRDEYYYRPSIDDKRQQYPIPVEIVDHRAKTTSIPQPIPVETEKKTNTIVDDPFSNMGPDPNQPTFSSKKKLSKIIDRSNPKPFPTTDVQVHRTEPVPVKTKPKLIRNEDVKSSKDSEHSHKQKVEKQQAVQADPAKIEAIRKLMKNIYPSGELPKFLPVREEDQRITEAVNTLNLEEYTSTLYWYDQRPSVTSENIAMPLLLSMGSPELLFFS